MNKTKMHPQVQIIVPLEACSIYETKSGKQWVEVAVPHESIASYDQKFGTFMVQPTQVRKPHYPMPMNTISVNSDAYLFVSIKDENHQFLFCEQLTPIGVIARWLKFYRYQLYSKRHCPSVNLDTPSVNLYKDYYHSGLRLDAYINRLPYVIFDDEKS